MDPHDVLAAFPRSLGPTPKQAEAYELAEDLIALHGAKGAAAPSVAYEHGSIAVRAIQTIADQQAQQLEIGPVYRRMPGGAIAVPTGRVLILFSEGTSAESRAPDLLRNGYELEESLSYAPHAAWVRARSSRISDALQNLRRLEELEGVERVTPQMIGEVARRG